MLIKSKFMKSAIVALAAGMVGSVAAPVANAAVDSNSYTIQPNSAYSKSSNQVGQNDGEDMSKATNDSNKVIVTNRDVTINGKTISKSEFKKALKSATFEDTNTVENSDPTFRVSLFVAPAAVAPLFIPGIGEAYITAAGTVVSLARRVERERGCQIRLLLTSKHIERIKPVLITISILSHALDVLRLKIDQKKDINQEAINEVVRDGKIIRNLHRRC